MTISLLGYAILSLLARVPLSGYDLAREMKKPHSFFFGQAQLSQIYPELARLEAAELVTSQIIEQRGRPDRKVYSILPPGRQQLERWVVSPTPPLEVRTEFLIKAHSLWLADPQQALLQFQEQERYHQANLAAYEASLAMLEERWGADLALVNGPSRLWRLPDRQARGRVRTRLHRLAAMGDGDPGRAGEAATWGASTRIESHPNGEIIKSQINWYKNPGVTAALNTHSFFRPDLRRWP